MTALERYTATGLTLKGETRERKREKSKMPKKKVCWVSQKGYQDIVNGTKDTNSYKI